MFDSPLMEMIEPVNMIERLDERRAQYFDESQGNVYCKGGSLNTVHEL